MYIVLLFFILVSLARVFSHPFQETNSQRQTARYDDTYTSNKLNYLMVFVLFLAKSAEISLAELMFISRNLTVYAYIFDLVVVDLFVALLD